MTSSCIASMEGIGRRLTQGEEWGWYFHPSSSSLTQGQRLALLSYWNHSQQAAPSLQPHTTGSRNSPSLHPWGSKDSQLEGGLGGTSSVLRTISEAPILTSMSHLSVGFSSNKSPPPLGPWLVHGGSLWLLSPEPCPQGLSPTDDPLCLHWFRARRAAHTLHLTLEWKDNSSEISALCGKLSSYPS